MPVPRPHDQCRLANDFVRDERKRLRACWIRGAIRLLDMFAEVGRWDEMIPIAERGIVRDRYREDFCFHLGTAWFQTGKYIEAFQACQDYEGSISHDRAMLPTRRMRDLRSRVEEVKRNGVGHAKRNGAGQCDSGGPNRHVTFNAGFER